MTDTHKAQIVPVEHREIQRMHPLVGAAMAHGQPFDPATLRELLAVQREWEAGEAKKAYTRALAGLKGDLPAVIKKDATVDFTSAKGRTFYKHTSLAGMMDAIIDPLTRHGFSLSWTPGMGERVVRVTCRLTHTEGHSEEATLEAPADTSGNKSPAQAIASTITLLQRYTALALLGIATADMAEPTGDGAKPADGDRVDVDKNMQAVKVIVKRGHKREEAEKIVGDARGADHPVPVSEWTANDRRAIKSWLGAEDSPVGEPTT